MPGHYKKGKVEKVMGEYKRGKLKSGSGAKVKGRKQAVAIALSEAREAGENVKESKGSASKRLSMRRKKV